MDQSVADLKSLPNSVYGQVATVVREARHDGIDVTLESRRFTWSPDSLYYLHGQNLASAVQVGIYAGYQAPPALADGRPEHIDLGWDTRLDDDGSHEDLTLVQGVLLMRTLDGHSSEVRRAIRQLIALTQAVGATSRPDSAIADGSRADHFTRADLAAMKLMSGC